MRFSRPYITPAIATALLAMTVLLSACSTLPAGGPLPAGLILTEITRIDPASPLAWSPQADRIAFVRQGLVLREISSGRETAVSEARPSALAWSPDGGSLVLASASAGQTRLEKIPLTGGPPLATTLPGDPVAVFWPRPEEVLAVSAELKVYSFGGNLMTRVARWEGNTPPQLQTLHDATLKPLTLRNWGGMLAASAHPDLAPTGDALLYARLHDPPEFPPYLKLVLRHLQGGDERLLGSLNLFSAGGRFAGSDDTLYVADGERETRRLDPWTGRQLDLLPLPGKSLAASPGGRYLVADSQLWRDGALALRLKAVEAARFSPLGDQVLLRVDDTLFLLSGLAPDPSPTLPQGAALDRLLLLRRWRAGGLITPEEFFTQRESLP